MSVFHSLPTLSANQAQPWDNAPSVRFLDVVSAVVMLAVAVGPTCFVLAAALEMFGIHAL